MLHTVSSCRVCLARSAFHRWGGVRGRPDPAELYPRGGVAVGEVGTVLAATKGVEVVQRLHASQRVGDHGDGAGRHEGDVVGRPAQGEGVVGRAGEAQRVVGLQRLALVVVLVLQLLLLHLQGHQLLTLQVGHVVGCGGRVAGSRVALRRRDAPVGLVPPLVFFVVECSEGEDVEEEQRRSDCYGDAELGGVIPLGLDHHGGLVRQVAALALISGLLGVRRRDPWVPGGGRPVVFAGEAFGVRVGGGVLWGDLGGGGHILKKLVDVVEMWDELQPEGDLGGAVMVPDSRLEADVEVQLVFGVVLGPGHLLEAVGFRVNELCILWNWLVWIPERGKQKKESKSNKRFYAAENMRRVDSHTSPLCRSIMTP